MKILTFVGLHFKLQFRRDASADKKGRVMSIITTVIALAAMLLLAKFLFDILGGHLVGDVTVQQFSSFLFTVIGVVLVLLAVSLEIRFFLKPADLNITARFPMSAAEMFTAQLLIVYIQLLCYSAMLILPTLLLFGWSWGVMSVGFVAQTLLSILVAPLVPFAIATLFVVPTMYILSVLENHNVVKLIIFVLLISAGFVLYNYILNFLAEYYIHNTINADTQAYVVNFILALNSEWNIFAWLGNIFGCVSLVKSLAIWLGATAVLGALGYLIIKPVYTRVRRNTLEGLVSKFSKASAMSGDGPKMAIFKKEFKDVIRTPTYAYFYLGISIITPVMVFLTNRLVQKVGEAQMGGNIAFGVSILVVLVFMIMICSFSANAVSREGKQFYITKIIPIDYRAQLLSKGLLNLLVAFGALFISVVILCSMRFITVLQGLILLINALLFSIGIIANGLNLNVRHPYVKGSNSDSTQTNATVLMIIGLLLCAVEGIIAIVVPFLLSEAIVYLAIGVITIVYCVINVLIFALTTNKKYSRIE